MNIAEILPWVQVVLALLLVGAVLMQQSDAGLGVLGGGSSEVVNHTRRGAEKTLFDATIVLAVLFVLSVFVSIVL